MNIPFVDLRAQYLSIRSEIDAAMQQVLEQTAFIGGKNPFVQAFEEAFATYLGIPHVVSCANGTDSLEILLKAYGIKAGDEVIVPAMSWISTAEAVSSVGARPMFVDIDPVYYTIDSSKIEAAITAKTKAIIPVHLYGQPADMDPIMQLAALHHLIVIEDCAQAHGAVYKGKKVGTIGHAASFSFYPGKNLGAYGDAGAMATADEHIASICRMIANHGQQGKHNHLMEGRNSRMDGLQAAVLSVKLKYLAEWTSRRQQHAAAYTSLLQHTLVVAPQVRPEAEHVFHLYVIRTKWRNELKNYMIQNGVECAIHYPTMLPALPAYKQRGYNINDFPNAFACQEQILSLPLYPELQEEQIVSIVSLIKSFYSNKSA